MPNPFDDESTSYVVLVNAENQHSLWPDFAATPAGWARVLGPCSRAECLAYVEASWFDMRPASLIATAPRTRGRI
jgi:MbtH protein